MANIVLKRCAIYTRKSSEEGLEQDYNSLHAQREACEAFTQSQAGEGWRPVKTAYDDGGFSGGTMERPALQQLMKDIREHKIDVVVVYKVDRLTRSLADFARMVELFDANGVSFVAVTQQFNTTTSMGRLTLNVLLSFAQFEREVIGERIRDKVAASKRKGIWMGGISPIGYEVLDRKLVINQSEAKTVRHIYEQYLKLGSVRLLKKELDRRGVVSAAKASRKGNVRGGKPFSRGALYNLLSNPVYIGEIRHKTERYPGQHPGIVKRELWEKVQHQLSSRAVRAGEGRKTEAAQSPLAGKLFDETGEPLYVQGAAKGQRRYRYYVSKGLVKGALAIDAEKSWRLSALEIERVVITAVQAMLGDHRSLTLVFEQSGDDINNPLQVIESAKRCSKGLRSNDTSLLSKIIERVDLSRGGVKLALKLPLLSAEGPDAGNPGHVSLSKFVPVEMKRRGVETKMVFQGDDTPRPVNLPLLRAVARARKWSDDLLSGRVRSVDEVAKREGLDPRSAHRLMRLGFLSPRIVEAIAEGRQPPDLTVIALARRLDLPLLWRAQDRALGVC
jgi:DNA invertase Pin-like site-specific DNA recombinase